MIKNMVKVYSLGLIIGNIKVNGKMAISMVKVHILTSNNKSNKPYGKMEKFKTSYIIIKTHHEQIYIYT